MLPILATLLISAPPADLDLTAVHARWHAAAAKFETLTLDGTQTTRDEAFDCEVKSRVVFRFLPPALARIDVYEAGNDRRLKHVWIVRGAGNDRGLQALDYARREVRRFALVAGHDDVRRWPLAACYFLPDPNAFKATIAAQTPEAVSVVLEAPAARPDRWAFGIFRSGFWQVGGEADWLAAKVRIDKSTWLPQRIALRETDNSTVEYAFPAPARTNEPLDDALFDPPELEDFTVVELFRRSRAFNEGRLVACPATFSDAHQVGPAGRRRHEPFPVPPVR